MSKEFKQIDDIIPETSGPEASSDENLISSLSQVKPKFFRRNIVLSFESSLDVSEDSYKKIDSKAIAKLRAKRFYPRKLQNQQEKNWRSSYSKPHLIVPNQTLRYISHIYILDFIDKNTVKVLKRTKCITSIQFKPDDFAIPSFYQLAKSFGNRISNIDLTGFVLADEQDRVKLYRALGHFAQLKQLRFDIKFRSYSWSEQEDPFTLEKPLIQRYLGRLSRLREFRITGWNDSKMLGELLRERRSQQCPLVTSLHITPIRTMLCSNLDIMALLRISKREEITSYDPVELRGSSTKAPSQIISTFFDFLKENGVVHQEKEDLNSIKLNKSFPISQRMLLFYKFDFGLFPNLRELNLAFNLGDSSDKQSSFLVGGFVTLQSLKKLSLKFDYRPYGTRLMFDEILDLPLLRHFSFEIPFIRDEEWDLFTQFIQKQHNLTLLHLSIAQFDMVNSPQYRKQSIGLGNALKALENTPKLQHLDLQFYDCPFTKFTQECLSNGLGQASATVNQLKSFSFTGVFLPVGYGTPSWNHLEGFCKFLQQQKISLTSLKINLDFLIDAGAASYISNIFPDLRRLKILNFQANTWNSTKLRSDYKQVITSNSYSKANLHSVLKMQTKTWNSLATDFQTIFTKLPTLEELIFKLKRSDLTFETKIDIEDTGYERSWKEDIYFKMVETLPNLQFLRNLSIAIPVEFHGSWKKRIRKIFTGLKHVNRIKIEFLEEEKYDKRLPRNYWRLIMAVEAENERKFYHILS